MFCCFKKLSTDPEQWRVNYEHNFSKFLFFLCFFFNKTVSHSICAGHVLFYCFQFKVMNSWSVILHEVFMRRFLIKGTQMFAYSCRSARMSQVLVGKIRVNHTDQTNMLLCWKPRVPLCFAGWCVKDKVGKPPSQHSPWAPFHPVHS